MESAGLGSKLWNKIKFFSNCLHNIEEGYREQIPIDISKIIRQVLLSSEIEATKIDFKLPPRLFINGWQGVIEEQIDPLLREIMSNARNALIQLPENQQRFIVNARIVGEFVEFEFMNTFNKKMINEAAFLVDESKEGGKRLGIVNPHIKNVGMSSMAIRIKEKLNGSIYEEEFPEIRLDDNPPVWCLRFALPAPWRE